MTEMQGLKRLAAIRRYCDYIERHLGNVDAAWKLLQEPCRDMRFIYDDYVHGSIEACVAAHDLSKFSPEEFIQYQRAFFPAEGEEKQELGDAWEHHQKENPHHWQNWTVQDFYNPYEAEVHCVCMVIDWMAMAIGLGGSAEQYYEDNKGTIDLPEWAVSLIRDIFDRIRESATDAMLRECGKGVGDG